MIDRTRGSEPGFWLVAVAERVEYSLVYLLACCTVEESRECDQALKLLSRRSRARSRTRSGSASSRATSIAAREMSKVKLAKEIKNTPYLLSRL